MRVITRERERERKRQRERERERERESVGVGLDGVNTRAKACRSAVLFLLRHRGEERKG